MVCEVRYHSEDFKNELIKLVANLDQPLAEFSHQQSIKLKCKARPFH